MGEAEWEGKASIFSNFFKQEIYGVFVSLTHLLIWHFLHEAVQPFKENYFKPGGEYSSDTC